MKGYETEQNIILLVWGSSTCKDCANTNLCKSLKLCVLDERKTEPEALDPRPSTSKQTHSTNPIFFFLSLLHFCFAEKSLRTHDHREKERERERKRGREVRIIERKGGMEKKNFPTKTFSWCNQASVEGRLLGQG